MLYIVVGILIFGALIAVHEFGHFITAKLFGVRVNEFSIGMGPALLHRQRGETEYSLRLFPVGGYCAMEGEDEDSEDPRAFGSAKLWKKVIILCAGAFMNFLAGLVMLLFLYRPMADAYLGPVEGYGTENCGLQAGDILLSVDGKEVTRLGQARTLLSEGGDTVTLVVERDGQRVDLGEVYLPFQSRTADDGTTTRIRGILVGGAKVQGTVMGRLEYAWDEAVYFAKVVWLGLRELVSGSLSLRDMSGPVGIVDTMNQVGSQSSTVQAGLINVVYLGALIAVNLAVMNLLPLPALDGGRVFFLVLNGVLYALFKKKIDPKYEGYVHMIGLFLLLGLMAVVTLSDVGKLFGK